MTDNFIPFVMTIKTSNGAAYSRFPSIQKRAFQVLIQIKGRCLNVSFFTA